MEELKLCPFCFSKPELKSFNSDDNNFTWYLVSCPFCGAEIRHPYTTKEEAMNRWNTREPKEITELTKSVDMDKLTKFKDAIVNKFGEQVLWASLFLLMQIDRKTWKFPEYVLVEPMKDIALFIEQNEDIKNVFQS